MTTAREELLAAGLAVFDRDGFEGATVAAIRARARASNGSFFHFFGSKKELAGTLFLEILARYHAAVIAAVDQSCGAREGVARLIRAHLEWVVTSRREARYLFEISRSEWTEEIRGAQRARNLRLAEAVERWRAPLVERGELLPMTSSVFFSQIIGPAQMFCRAWLSGRDRVDPREQTDILIAWLDSPGVRLVHLSDTWACPVRAAGAHAELTWASDRVRTEISAEASTELGSPIGSTNDTEIGKEISTDDGVTEPNNPPHVDTMTAC